MTIGSSWTTAGTVGVGLIEVAGALGVSTAITVGAVVAGAYLGDKLSPISETTVLTAQMVGVRVDEHVKRQARTSIPAFLISFVILLILSLVNGPNVHAPLATTSPGPVRTPGVGVRAAGARVRAAQRAAQHPADQHSAATHRKTGE